MSKSDDENLRPATKLVQGGRRPEWTGDPRLGGSVVNPPVWRASTILYDNIADLEARGHATHDKLYYGRRGTPTVWALADALTDMEPGAAGTLLYPSGVAANSAGLLALLAPGDHLLMVDSAYEPTRAFCDGLLKRYGVTTTYYDPLVGAGIADLITPANQADLPRIAGQPDLRGAGHSGDHRGCARARGADDARQHLGDAAAVSRAGAWRRRDDDEPDQICRRPQRRDDGIADRDQSGVAAAAQRGVSAGAGGFARRLRADAARAAHARRADGAAWRKRADGRQLARRASRKSRVSSTPRSPATPATRSGRAISAGPADCSASR